MYNKVKENEGNCRPRTLCVGHNGKRCFGALIL